MRLKNKGEIITDAVFCLLHNDGNNNNNNFVLSCCSAIANDKTLIGHY